MTETAAGSLSIRACRLEDIQSVLELWRQAEATPGVTDTADDLRRAVADRASVERVVRRFLELQGDDLSEGLVFREFVEFEPLGRHPKSGMPLTKEYRLVGLGARPPTARKNHKQRNPLLDQEWPPHRPKQAR